MRTRALAGMVAVMLVAAGCVARPHGETAALRSTWPTPPTGALAASVATNADWPSVRGDILAGTSPAELAKARATVSQPLTEALAKP